jgi:hypothetical protein
MVLERQHLHVWRPRRVCKWRRLLVACHHAQRLWEHLLQTARLSLNGRLRTISRWCCRFLAPRFPSLLAMRTIHAKCAREVQWFGRRRLRIRASYVFPAIRVNVA